MLTVAAGLVGWYLLLVCPAMAQTLAAPDSIESREWLSVDVGLLLIAFVSLGMTAWAALAAQKSASAAQQALALSYPPRLSVNPIAVWREEEGTITQYSPPSMTPGENLQGWIWVRNQTSECAAFSKAKFFVFWHDTEHPPMAGPAEFYETRDDNFPLDEPAGFFDSNPKQIKRMEDGSRAAFWRFNTKVEAGRFLFVRGRIIFTDRFQRLHAIHFYRRYDPLQQRFIRLESFEVSY